MNKKITTLLLLVTITTGVNAAQEVENGVQEQERLKQSIIEKERERIRKLSESIKDDLNIAYRIQKKEEDTKKPLKEERKVTVNGKEVNGHNDVLDIKYKKNQEIRKINIPKNENFKNEIKKKEIAYKKKYVLNKKRYKKERINNVKLRYLERINKIEQCVLLSEEMEDLQLCNRRVQKMSRDISKMERKLKKRILK